MACGQCEDWLALQPNVLMAHGQRVALTRVDSHGQHTWTEVRGQHHVDKKRVDERLWTARGEGAWTARGDGT